LPDQDYLSYVGYIENGEEALDLSSFKQNEVSIEGWQIIPFCHYNKEAYSENYDRLNVLVRNLWMQVDGGGITKIYNKTSGIVRYSNYGISWIHKLNGWDLLPEF